MPISNPLLIRLQRLLNAERNQWAYNRQSLDSGGIPEVFQIELTNHCPMACIMCPRTHGMTRSQGFMEVTLFERILEQISPYTSRLFLHHFGDSLLHPQLGECLRLARQHGLKAYLSTNPNLLTEDRVHTLVAEGLEELVISLDGFSAETSAAVRGPAARDLPRAEHNINALLTYRRSRGVSLPKIIMQFIEHWLNHHETAAWLEKWRAVEGIDKVKVKRFVAWDGRDARINGLRPENVERDTQPGVVCDKPWTSVAVLWDGRVVPCCFDYDGLYVLGDLSRQSLREICADAPLRALRQAHRLGALADIVLCARCTDQEGYRTGKWYYPLNRFLSQQMPLGAENEDVQFST